MQKGEGGENSPEKKSPPLPACERKGKRKMVLLTPKGQRMMGIFSQEEKKKKGPLFLSLLSMGN